MTAAVAPPTLDPFAEGFFDDPYPQYAVLREQNPVHSNQRGVTLFFTFDDVRRVLIDPRNTSMDRVRSLTAGGATNVSPPPTFPLSILNTDPPDHSRLRKLMSKSFTARRVEALVDWMDHRVDRLLDAMELEHRATGEPVDLVGGLAFPFPFTVISEMLGMPDGDDEQVRTWAHEISAASDPVVPREHVQLAAATYRTMCAYMNEQVLPWKRAHLGDDLLSSMLAAEAEGSVSSEELLDNVALLYVAGHETTSGLIGNGILNLLRHRDQLALLQADPTLLPNAVEELNRYEGSIQFAWRYVVNPLAVGEHLLEPGQMAFVCCGSANRDPEHFGPTADVLDITRSTAGDGLSFGAGMHFCLGAHLARREVMIVIQKFFERFPRAAQAGEVTWSRGMTFRQLRSFPVSLW
jgi:cytochrome P450